MIALTQYIHGEAVKELNELHTPSKFKIQFLFNDIFVTNLSDVWHSVETVMEIYSLYFDMYSKISLFCYGGMYTNILYIAYRPKIQISPSLPSNRKLKSKAFIEAFGRILVGHVLVVHVNTLQMFHVLVLSHMQHTIFRIKQTNKTEKHRNRPFQVLRIFQFYWEKFQFIRFEKQKCGCAYEIHLHFDRFAHYTH